MPGLRATPFLPDTVKSSREDVLADGFVAGDFSGVGFGQRIIGLAFYPFPILRLRETR